MYQTLLTLILITCLTRVNAQFWLRCNNTEGIMPNSVVSPACTGSTCRLVRGGRLYAEVVFTPRQEHKDLKVRVSATRFGEIMPLPRKPPHDNACNSIFFNGVKQSCPIQSGRRYTWITDMDLPLTIPILNTRIRYELWDGEREVLCVTINGVLI